MEYFSLDLPMSMDLSGRAWRRQIRDLVDVKLTGKICVMVISSKDRKASYTFCNTHEEADMLLLSEGLNANLSSPDFGRRTPEISDSFKFKRDPL